MNFGGRATGRTTAICNAVRELDGIVIAANAVHAIHIKREHGVRTLPMSCLDRLVGTDTPVVWDHFTAEKLYSDLEDTKEIAAKLVRENARLKKQSGKLLSELKKKAEELRYSERLFFVPVYVTEQTLQQALMEILDAILDEA